MLIKMTEEKYYNSLNIALQSDYRKLENLRNGFKSWEGAWNSLNGGVPRLPAVASAKEGLPDPEEEWEKLLNFGVGLVLKESPQYPSLLKEIPQPPFGIYFIGRWPKETNLTLAVVGTRKATAEGRALAKKFGFEFSENGFQIVSGLALGIDAAAHEGVVEAGGGAVAVLGNGLDSIYPKTNERLAKKILEKNGAIISEYPVGSESLPYRFLERNRIISGFSRGTLVIEVPLSSGALVTARFALDQNRDVFVVPGPITHPNFVGSNQLIREGAELITKPEEIMEAFGIETAEGTRATLVETDAEKKIIAALKNFSSPVGVDKILELTNLNISEANRALAFLTIKNAVKETGDGYSL